MRKLAYVITQSELGGAQRNIILLAAKLKDSYDITVYTGPGGRMIDELKKLNIKVVQVHSLVREINLSKDLSAYRFLLTEFKKNNYDIVHSHSSKAGLIARLAASRAKVKKNIYTAHGFVFNEPMSNLKKSIYIFLEKFAARISSDLICVSPLDRVEAKKNHITPGGDIYYIPNGIDFEHYSIDKTVMRKKLKLDDKSFIFGFVANFYETKGHRYLIKAFNELCKEGYDSYLLLIGDGILKAELEELTEGNDKIKFLGFREDADQLLGAFDCFVMSSVKEGFPFVILEALRAKVPVISTNVGAIPEILEHGRLGLITKPADAGELKDKMAYAINNRESLIRTADEAYTSSRNNFSLENMVNLTKAIYDLKR